MTPKSVADLDAQTLRQSCRRIRSIATEVISATRTRGMRGSGRCSACPSSLPRSSYNQRAHAHSLFAVRMAQDTTSQRGIRFAIVEGAGRRRRRIVQIPCEIARTPDVPTVRLGSSQPGPLNSQCPCRIGSVLALDLAQIGARAAVLVGRASLPMPFLVRRTVPCEGLVATGPTVAAVGPSTCRAQYTRLRLRARHEEARSGRHLCMPIQESRSHSHRRFPGCGPEVR
ncbi:uncharacterized protein B0H18DRAFT_188106 [Fomitopsis serialis]|uniref:uncharacterized protein n=1 Tax=Fomitopsis serialis TaxID=139415 RepID=UPI0020079C3E|nr:uncharacterized protein B0H18DRAFT_188106 [Neoantrodia serialis]KAH9937125.1 hypothetical protein B0H18DRAFT_188106 [Neoantrodia serialis]